MYKYVFYVHYCRHERDLDLSLDEVIEIAAIDLEYSFIRKAYPYQILDSEGNILLDEEELNDKCWEYISQKHNWVE